MQHNDVGGPFGNHAFGSGDGGVQWVRIVFGCRVGQYIGAQPGRRSRRGFVGVITVIERSEPTPAAAVNVSTSMASTTFSRVCAENTGASLVWPRPSA